MPGDTEPEIEPAATGVTGPIPLSIESAVAPFVVHDSVDGLPATTEGGETESVQVGATGGGGGGMVQKIVRGLPMSDGFAPPEMSIA